MDAHDDEFQGVSAGKSGRRQDFTVRAGTGLAAALEARGASAVEARCGGQLVDAIVHAGGDTGVVYVSSRELSLMPCASASAGRGRGSAGGLKGWMKCAAGKQKAGEDADGGSVSAEESWQSTKARIDALKAFPRAVLVVERARECDQGRTVALQMDLSVRHTPSIPVIPVSDWTGFITFLVVRGRDQHAGDRGAASKGRKGALVTDRLVTDRRLRTLLMCLPGVHEPLAHQVLVPFVQGSGD
eukprot:Tamp_18397.p1 GENE.Tamp_18397~~Tamp_18397.p1  ORF type:complete len:243 (+),score=24.53 Tamp_18397:8-736(+)